MKRSNLFAFVIRIFAVLVTITFYFQVCMVVQSVHAQEKSSGTAVINLPQPVLDGSVSVEKALSERRSVRSYKDQPLTIPEVSQLLWAAQGITEPKRGLRTAPSARAQYLIQVYIISEKITGLPMGMYKYQPTGHKLIRIADGDIKANLMGAVAQASIKNALAAIVICGLSEKSRNPSWMYLEAGHAAQNVYLQVVSLNVGTVTMAGFKPEEVKKVLKLPDSDYPNLYYAHR